MRYEESYRLASDLLEKKIEPWIGVDLDGTLAKTVKGTFDPEKIGPPVAKMAERIRRWRKAGKTVKIFTARASEKKNLAPIKAWLKKHGLGDLEVTNEKDPGMTELWDDRAVEVIKDTGETN